MNLTFATLDTKMGLAVKNEIAYSIPKSIVVKRTMAQKMVNLSR